MTDIHSHIIFNVDDGSYSLEESIALIKKMKQAGFDNIIMTPHYISSTDYASPNEEKLAKLKVLREQVKAENIDIKLYLGNEIFITDHIVEDIKNERIYPLNNTQYILFEIPFHNQIIGLSDIVYELKIAGYQPILAHPERYTYFQKNYQLVDELKKEGLLFQCNFSSIIGDYGHESKRLIKYMLKKQYVDYLGTDIHHLNRTSVIDNFDKIKKAIIKITGNDYYLRIINNADNLVN